jgi:hypothetical protein
LKNYLTILLAFCSFNLNAQKAFFSAHNNEPSRFVQSTLAAKVITSGLIQNLDANNSTSYGGTGNNWTDLAGTNHGTIVGGTFTTSGGVSFFNFPTASVASYVSAPLNKTASMTFNVWAKINTIPVPNCMLFNAGTSPNGPDVFFENTAISWNVWDGSTTTFKNGGVNINSTTVVGNTNWHNYTFCVDAASNNVKMYLDGVLVGTSNYWSPIRNTATALYIGGAGAGDNAWNWIGGISIFQSYNRALTATEVNTNFNALKSRFGY